MRLGVLAVAGLVGLAERPAAAGEAFVRAPTSAVADMGRSVRRHTDSANDSRDAVRRAGRPARSPIGAFFAEARDRRLIQGIKQRLQEGALAYVMAEHGERIRTNAELLGRLGFDSRATFDKWLSAYRHDGKDRDYRAALNELKDIVDRRAGDRAAMGGFTRGFAVFFSVLPGNAPERARRSVASRLLSKAIWGAARPSIFITPQPMDADPGARRGPFARFREGRSAQPEILRGRLHQLFEAQLLAMVADELLDGEPQSLLMRWGYSLQRAVYNWALKRVLAMAQLGHPQAAALATYLDLDHNNLLDPSPKLSAEQLDRVYTARRQQAEILLQTAAQLVRFRTQLGRRISDSDVAEVAKLACTRAQALEAEARAPEVEAEGGLTRQALRLGPRELMTQAFLQAWLSGESGADPEAALASVGFPGRSEFREQRQLEAALTDAMGSTGTAQRVSAAIPKLSELADPEMLPSVGGSAFHGGQHGGKAGISSGGSIGGTPTVRHAAGHR